MVMVHRSELKQVRVELYTVLEKLSNIKTLFFSFYFKTSCEPGSKRRPRYPGLKHSLTTFLLKNVPAVKKPVKAQAHILVLKMWKKEMQSVSCNVSY